MTKRMMNSLATMTCALALGTLATVSSHAQEKSDVISSQAVMVGGVAMYPSKTIIQNAIYSKDHTTLIAVVKAADLVDTLRGDGPFTLFAPTNAAFAKLPAGTVDTLEKPENKVRLTKILTYHIVAGKLSTADFADGKTLTTVEGEALTVKKSGARVTLVDAKGGSSTVTIPDVNQSNGVIHAGRYGVDAEELSGPDFVHVQRVHPGSGLLNRTPPFHHHEPRRALKSLAARGIA